MNIRKAKTIADVYLWICEMMNNEEEYEDPSEYPEEFSIAEEGEWVSEGKYEITSTVYYHKTTNSYWKVSLSRHGDYWHGYEIDQDSTIIHQVIPKEVITISWQIVK